MNWQSERPETKALAEAYFAGTGLKLAWSYQRSMDLAELVAREVKPEDVLAVIGFIKAKIRRGDTGFGETSLLWRNAMQPDAMEERAVLVRQHAARKVKPKPQMPRTDAAQITRLDVAPTADPQPVIKVLAAELFDMARKMNRGA